MEKQSVINASDVKPNFSKVKEVWQEMLSKYYDDRKTLRKEFVIDVNCPHCVSDKTHSSFNLNGFDHHKCKNCGSVYVSPRLKDECLHTLYSDNYYSEMFTKSMIPFFEKRKELIGVNKFNQIAENIISEPPNNRVLDIGCGVGEVIDVFNDNGWDCEAIELNPVASDWLNQRGIKVFNDTLDNYNSNQEFDVVMAWNVVEHVTNPKDFVKKAFDLLRPGGLFVSEVPHGNSMLVDYCRSSGLDPLRILQGEQHIMLYSISAYKELHEIAGFKPELIQTNGLDVGTILDCLGTEIRRESISLMQDLIDSKLYGDLLRGFWKKPI
jgi:2-polyprenyl-3-methyl-5-hydroxy-6-metoxy-1,4-benzoquinol methylase